jgi:Tat protein translocase TatB subunit
MFGFGFTEIILIAALALIVIGPKRLPEVARAVGKGLTEFKGALDEVKKSVQQEVHKPMMDAKSDYLETILAERDAASKDAEGSKPKSEAQSQPGPQPGPPPDTDASLGTPEDRKFSDLPYKNTDNDAGAKAESESVKTSSQKAGSDGDEKV